MCVILCVLDMRIRMAYTHYDYADIVLGRSDLNTLFEHELRGHIGTARKCLREHPGDLRTAVQRCTSPLLSPLPWAIRLYQNLREAGSPDRQRLQPLFLLLLPSFAASFACPNKEKIVSISCFGFIFFSLTL